MEELDYIPNWIASFENKDYLFNEDEIRRDAAKKYSNLNDGLEAAQTNRMIKKYRTAHEWVLNTYNFIMEHHTTGRSGEVTRLDFFLSGFGPESTHPKDIDRFIDYVLHESKKELSQGKNKIENAVKVKNDVKRLEKGMKWILRTKEYFKERTLRNI